MKKTLALLLLIPFFGCDCEGGGGLHQKKADITVSPNPLVFDTIPRGTTASLLLHVENPGDFRLEVASVTLEEGAAEGFSLAGETAFQVEPGASHDLEVRFSAADLTDVDGTLLIQSNAAEKEETRVTLQATRRQGPVLVVCVESIDIPLGFTCGAPGSLDFGRVRLTETHHALVTLRSEGTDPITVSSVALSGHPSIAIDVPTVPATIAVGEFISVPVRFTASVQEQIEGTIAIQSNDGVTPNTEVAIRGQGAELGLCIEPAILDFGGVSVGSSKDLPLRLSNCGSAPIDITGAEVFVGSEFSVVSPITTPITLSAQAGFNFELDMRYAPTEEGIDDGRLRIITSNGNALVPMTGDSNGCRLTVTPTSLSFVYDPNQGSEAKNLLIENTGSQDCTITRLEISEGADKGFQWNGGIGPDRGSPFPELPQVLSTGESLTVNIGFWPNGATTAEVRGKIEIEAEERPGMIHTVDLIGTIDVSSICDLTVTPMTLSYGVLNVGQRRILGVRLSNGNAGFLACELDSLGLSNDGGGSFILSENPPEIVLGEAVVFVEFAPAAAGIHTGTLEVVAGGDTPQTFTVSLTGAAGSAGLCVEPRELPFGERNTAGTLDFNISACGSDPITVDALAWTFADTELSILNPPALPFTLAASENRTVTVQYNPQDQAGDTGILAVRSTDPVKPEITVRATGGREIVPPEAGRYLYYWQIVNGASDIARQPLQGDLTSEPYWGDRAGQGCGACHQLSPDGKFLAVATLTAFGGSISVVDVEANAVSTAPGNTVDALYMSWNPDVNTNPPYQYVYSLNGGLHVASLYTGYIGPLEGADEVGVFETMPSWGPDGQIAFVAADSECGIGCTGTTSIFLVDEAGGSATALMGASNNNIGNYYPRFSPNGMWIAYTTSQQALGTISAPDAMIRAVRTDNSGTVLDLPQLNGGASSYPTWSANGEFLSFSSNRAGGLGGWDIYLAPIDPVTAEEQPATNLMEANTNGFEHSAQWSP